MGVVQMDINLEFRPSYQHFRGENRADESENLDMIGI